MYSDNAYTIIALSYTLTDLTFDDVFYLGLRATFLVSRLNPTTRDNKAYNKYKNV